MIIISGPSTVGKNPLIYKACELYNLSYVTPCTTRLMRCEEVDGKDYYFLAQSEFQTKIKLGRITEWDYCLNNYYGYMFDFPGERHHITHGLSRMALRIKSKYPEMITTVFIMSNNLDRIYGNLNQIYHGETLILRRALVNEEICHSVLFDKVFTYSESVFDLLKDNELQQLLSESGR